MTVLVDSDILIEVTRGRDPAIVSKWKELSRSNWAVLFSSISVAELWAGARPSEHASLDALFQTRMCVPVDEKIGRQAGAYLRGFAKSHGVALGDAIIAASAIASNASLWTGNRKHYPMKGISFFE